MEGRKSISSSYVPLSFPSTFKGIEIIRAWGRGGEKEKKKKRGGKRKVGVSLE